MISYYFWFFLLDMSWQHSCHFPVENLCVCVFSLEWLIRSKCGVGLCSLATKIIDSYDSSLFLILSTRHVITTTFLSFSCWRLPVWLNRLRCRHCSVAYFADSSPTQGRRLVTDAQDQQPFESREWGLRVVLSGHFCTSLNVRHARRKQAGIEVQEYLPEAQIKTGTESP